MIGVMRVLKFGRLEATDMIVGSWERKKKIKEEKKEKKKKNFYFFPYFFSFAIQTL